MPAIVVDDNRYELSLADGRNADRFGVTLGVPTRLPTDRLSPSAGCEYPRSPRVSTPAKPRAARKPRGGRSRIDRILTRWSDSPVSPRAKARYPSSICPISSTSFCSNSLSAELSSNANDNLNRVNIVRILWLTPLSIAVRCSLARSNSPLHFNKGMARLPDFACAMRSEVGILPRQNPPPLSPGAKWAGFDCAGK